MNEPKTNFQSNLAEVAKAESKLLAEKSNEYFAALLKHPRVHRDGQYLHPKLQYLMEADSTTVLFEELEKDPRNWESAEGLMRIREGVDIDWTVRAIDVRSQVDVEELDIPGSDGRNIHVIVSRPRRSSRKILPVVLYFHGGGFLIGSARALQPHAELISYICEALVINVDYRLAPEHKFPAAYQDAFDVHAWCLQHVGTMGGDPNRIDAAGDSAGGSLSLNIARAQNHTHGRPLKALLLYYPMTDTRMDYRSYELFGEGLGLDRNFAETFRQLVYQDTADEDHAYLRPISWSDVAQLPPTIIATAGFDIIRDQGNEFGARMCAAGCDIQLRTYHGLNHSFIKNAGVIDEARDACLSTAVQLKIILDRSD